MNKKISQLDTDAQITQAIHASEVAQSKPSKKLMKSILNSLEVGDDAVNNAQSASTERRWMFMTPKLMWSIAGGFALVLLVISGVSMLGTPATNFATNEFTQAENEFAQMETDMELVAEFEDFAVEEDLAALAFLDEDNSSDAPIAQTATTTLANPTSNTPTVQTSAIEVDIEGLDDLDMDLGELDMDDITI